MMKKKIMTIGGATHDIFIRYHPIEMIDVYTESEHRSFVALEEGSKIEVEALSHHTGGGSTNSAISFKRQGFLVSSFFKVGTDPEGTFIVQQLKKESVDTKYSARSKKMPTATSFIIPTEKKDRAILVYRGANLSITKKDLPLKELPHYNQLYITSLSGPTASLLQPITHAAKKKNIPVATNPGTSQLREGADILCASLPNIDILILNSFEAKLCMKSLITSNQQLQPARVQRKTPQKKKMGPLLLQEPITYQNICFNLRNFFKEIIKRGPKVVVVTNGAEGVYVATKKQILFHPSLPVEIVNTLGAGDAFGSCFVANLLQGKSVEDALRCGIINSASVIKYLDAKTGLLTEKQLTKKLKCIDKKLLRSFSM